jgi:hypothetical protein
MYAAAVSSGNSPFEPRWATLYGRDVCRGCLSPSSSLLGSFGNCLPTHPPMIRRITKGIKPVKHKTSMFTLVFFKQKENSFGTHGWNTKVDAAFRIL